MSRRFNLTFQDLEEMEFFDILSLEDQQINEVLEIASKNTKLDLQCLQDKGLDISYLTEKQKKRVITSKNRIVLSRNVEELYREKKVVFTSHSLNRLLEREGSNTQETILITIQRIIDADKVSKAQFKGYSSLSYTLTEVGDTASYKLPISFKWVKGSRQILAVTVSHRNAPPSIMTSKIVHNKELSDGLAEYRRKLVERSKEN